ncbi:PTS cellobiose transporter subunit IIC [Streptococcus ruminantium]|uniref:Permease IIC component n=1 Tax=Streptococcus ruminantium TaxID=1917441 RepID=A0ABU1B1K0_9STRE|nr:PTS cellobiose transporter subunit IIC [Streptococcus ruminantium]MDQ8758586.1 PTS cellobiose transporter subunit IIC [Streptococcus ruminantium]MDQ8764267.1 PTS cellobiose transporter subunit IIC [Streptococcus ruminantium]MDQ8766209.1 PTS cellobiose transporter subunit IIC [Streptococcus ruminantium]MDQ8769346.1 PTS cellobiose transporter subunit IIC [Streptococcus ruminantium]MDQ8774138.1 PTS cellobiose transporter subunit IIC [Streptococcus ruminantium]
MFEFLEKYLMGPMGKISQYKFVRAITAAGMASIPFTIVGSMFLVFNILPLTFSHPAFVNFFNNTFAKFSDLYMLANGATMGILALYFNLALGYEFTKIYAEEDDLNLSPLNGALLSMFAFFMTLPQLVFKDGAISLVNDAKATIVNGWAIGGSGVNRLGSIGIFTAIIMAVLAVQLYRLCVTKNWVVKMPDSVPEGVSRGFTALIPAFVVAFAVLIINGIFIALGTDIFQVVAIPFGFVANITNSWLGLMVIYFLVQSLWIVGIHGANIIFAFVTPIALVNMAANNNGAAIPLAGEFSNMFVTMGGSGATLGLIIYLAYMSKAEQLKMLGRASIAPAIFNINEPIIFGLPIIYNPALAIPFFLAPMASATVGYFAIKLGLCNPVVAQMPWPSPAGIGAFIGTGGDWRAAVVALVCALVAFLVYFPFIKMYDEKLYKEEQGLV